MSNRFRKIILFILGVVILGGFTFNKLQENSKKLQSKKVSKTQVSERMIGIEMTPTLTPIQSPSLSPTPTTVVLSKKIYTIAAFGDSMIDTMGEGLDYVDHAMHAKYPGTDFRFYNYGIGSQTIETGIGRWDQNFSNQTRNYPPITNISADIIILGSFSYNPFLVHDVNKHSLLLKQLIERAKKTNAMVYLLAEIAPLYDNFGQGPHGPNMTLENAHAQADRIIEQLETVDGIAKSQNVTLIDAFTPTQVDGKYGNKNLVNSDDGIHPSIAGQTYVANKIANTVILK